MGSLSRILIKDLDKETVVELIQQYYSIGRKAVFDYENRSAFSDEMNDAFTIFDAYINGWTEIAADYILPGEEHDMFLTTISKDFKTTVILGYVQTTTGDAQFLVLKNGQIIRSIYQKSSYNPHRLIMKYNAGEKLAFEKDFIYAEIGQDITDYKFLNFDEIQEMFYEAGYTGENRTYADREYLHLEYLKKT